MNEANDKLPTERGFTARGYTDPTDDPAYQEYVNKCAEHCTCEPPHQRPCDGVLAGGMCDQMFEDISLNEPDTDMSEE